MRQLRSIRRSSRRSRRTRSRRSTSRRFSGAQGHYDEALATLEKAKALVDGLRSSSATTKALIYDSLGRYDEGDPVAERAAAHARRIRTASTLKARSRIAPSSSTGWRMSTANRTRPPRRSTRTSRWSSWAATTLSAATRARSTPTAMPAVEKATDGCAEAAKACRRISRAADVWPAACRYGQGRRGLALAKAQLTGTADEDRDVYLALAQIYIRLKRWKEAAEETRQGGGAADQADDDKLYVYFLRGALYDRQKMYDEAEEQFRKALAIDPQNAVLNYLGYMLADRGVQAAGGAGDDPQGGRARSAELCVSRLAGLGLLQDRPVCPGGGEPAQGERARSPPTRPSTIIWARCTRRPETEDGGRAVGAVAGGVCDARCPPMPILAM